MSNTILTWIYSSKSQESRGRSSVVLCSKTVFKWTDVSCATQCLKLEPVCWASVKVLCYDNPPPLFLFYFFFKNLGDLGLQKVSKTLLELNTTRNCLQQGSQHQIQSNINFLCGKTLVSLNRVFLSSMEMAYISNLLFKETCCTHLLITKLHSLRKSQLCFSRVMIYCGFQNSVPSRK